ncbi:MAG: hypothetical protein WD669_12300 [Pirellulales bacterium]
MSSVYFPTDSYVLPFCPLVTIPDGAAVDAIEPCQAEVDAAQAVAAYRRVEETADGLELNLSDDRSDALPR